MQDEAHEHSKLWRIGVQYSILGCMIVFLDVVIGFTLRVSSRQENTPPS